jgi:hypothetical protein
MIAVWFTVMYFVTMYFLQEIQNNINNPWIMVNLVFVYTFIFVSSVVVLLVALAVIECIADMGKRI